MYQLQQALSTVHGIGDSWTAALAKRNIHSILDLLLNLPLRYEDRSTVLSIAQLQRFDNSSLIPESQNSTGVEKKKNSYQSQQEFFTLIVQVKDYRQYYKGRLLISRATLFDDTGELAAIWFNNKFIKNKLKTGQQYYASGQLKNNSLVQANLEPLGSDSPHTARLVPIYSKVANFKQGNLRRVLKEIIDNLSEQEKISQNNQLAEKRWQNFANPQQFFQALHFPQSIEEIIEAREQLALEEIIYLINKAKDLKRAWQEHSLAPNINIQKDNLIPKTLPFTLTKAQTKAVKEITSDLEKSTAMNRLLIGDVGSGKTVVAAIAAWHACLAGHNVALVAPTQILAQQHYQSLKKLLPQQKIVLVTAQTSKNFKLGKQTIYVGTHALINKLEKIKPALIIYDEQHRFGTKQRQSLGAHLLSMTATPIPRSLMLTIFAHLQTSILDEMPANRQIAKTWLVPKHKETKATEWLAEKLLESNNRQALVICPFIDPSQHGALENVAAVKDSLEKLTNLFDDYYQKNNIQKSKQLKLASLHSRLKKKEQAEIIQQLYDKQIQILISTPMVEVGVDLPNADIILIQAAERFGLASLHQLRGRVGRVGQESFCLLFTSQEKNSSSQERLKNFCQEKDGFKLAQLDLKQRGAGDIFGNIQSGFDKLQFASWANLKIIEQAKKISDSDKNYQSLLTPYFDKREFLETVNNN